VADGGHSFRPHVKCNTDFAKSGELIGSPVWLKVSFPPRLQAGGQRARAPGNGCNRFRRFAKRLKPLGCFGAGLPPWQNNKALPQPELSLAAAPQQEKLVSPAVLLFNWWELVAALITGG